MPNIQGFNIEKVAVVDDIKDKRETLCDEVEDADFTPAPIEEGTFGDINELVNLIKKLSNAAICDHFLQHGNFAQFLGAELVSLLYLSRFPAVLVSGYFKADVTLFRKYRRNIPVLLKSEDTNPDTLFEGIEYCVKELKNDFSPKRKPWQSIFRIERIDTTTTHTIYVILPSWSTSEVIGLTPDIFPDEVTDFIKNGANFYADINTGAEDQDELYFSNIQYRGD